MTDKQPYSIGVPQYAWECDLFGLGGGYVLHLEAGKPYPNWLWRKMQYLAFGNRWRYVGKVNP
jgi:hypothetical protein